MNERTITIASVIVLAVTLLGGGAGIYYLHTVKAQKDTVLAALEVEVADHRKKQKEIPDLRKRKADLENKIKAGEERVPKLDELQFDELADLLDNLRKLSSTHITDAKFTPQGKGASQAPTSSTMMRADYDLNVKGGFFNLLRLLNLLEAQKRYIAVESFKIGQGEGAQGKGSAPVRSLRIRLYSFTRRLTLGAQPTGARPTDPEKPPQSTPLPQ